MKKLQEFKEESWKTPVEMELTGLIRSPNGASEVFLLLHGLNERGRRIYRKLNPILPLASIVLAPNGVYPMPRVKEGSHIEFGYAWYYYDKNISRYVIDQDLAIQSLNQLLKQKNPDNLPVTIIGFSQGGYLAPVLAERLPNVKAVVGICCEFRSSLVKAPTFPLIAVHGVADDVVTPAMAMEQIELLKERGINCEWYPVEGAGHEINPGIVAAISQIVGKL